MDAPVRVVYVGPDPADPPATLTDDPTVAIRATGPDGLRTAIDDTTPDCLLVDDRLDGGAIGAVEGLSPVADAIPAVLCSPAPDGELATAATAVADGYLALSAVGDDPLTDYLPTAAGDGGTAVVGESFDAAFETVSESIADGVVTADADGRIVYCNGGLADLTGRDREDLVGEPLTTLMPDRFQDPHETGFEQYLATGDRTLDWSSVELSVERADGEELPVEISFGEFERDGDRYFTGTIRDVAERKERERALRAAKDLSERVVERIEDGFFALDEDWQFTYVNERAGDILDRDPDALLGTNIWEEFPEAVGESFESEYQRAMNDQTAVSFKEFFAPLDVWFEVSVYPDDRGLSVFFQDITERYRRERMLNELLTTSQRLQTASTKESIAEVATEAVADVLGFELNVVRLYDPETQALVVSASTDAVEEAMPDRPVYDAAESLPGEAFQSGELIVREGVSAGGVDAALYVPLGEYGTMSIGTAAVEQIGTVERRIAALLGENVTAAFERAEREQRLAEYELVLENVQGMLYVLDEEGRFTMVTDPLADWLGYDSETLLGEEVSRVLTPEGEADGERLLGRLLDGEASSGTYETTLETRDGDTRPAEVELSLLPTESRYRGTVGTVRDLSTLRRTRRELAAQSDRFRSLFERVPDPVVEVEFDGTTPRLLSANAAFEETFGIDPDEARGRSINELIVPPEGKDGARTIDESVLQRETITEELRRETVAGPRTFLFRGAVFERPDYGTVGFGIYTDVTELRERGRRLEVLQRLLRHNLRTEMTVADGHLNDLGDRLASEPPELAAVEDAIDNVLAMSEEVRRIERAVEGAGETTTSPVGDLVRDAVERARARFPAATVETDLERGAGRVDDRLRLALEHVVENAIDHNDRQSPTVEVTCRGLGDGRIELQVADDGPGIPETERELLADDAAISQLQHGSGLGLWATQWVTVALGGTLSFATRSPRGSVVTLTLPPAGDRSEQ